jgi:PIN domain nuclease of toxin-antitoxin system
MRLLLDSHYVLWLALNRNALSTDEMAILIDPDNQLAVSSVSIWELRVKWETTFVSGERKGPANPVDVLDGIRSMGITVIELDPVHAATALQGGIKTKDPFDDMLLVQAQETGMKLFTRDGKLKDHPLAFFA